MSPEQDAINVLPPRPLLALREPVALPAPRLPTIVLRPRDRRIGTISASQAASRLHVALRTLQRQLVEAPKDGRGAVREGPFKGSFRRGVVWRIPEACVSQAEQAAMRDSDRELERRLLAAVDARIAEIGVELGQMIATAFAEVVKRP